MEVISDEIIIYGLTTLLIVSVLLIYILRQRKISKTTQKKINIAKADGVHEPVSLYPVIDPNRCIKSGACVLACPEKEVLGIVNGRASIINATRCIGHGACFQACPTEAISLAIGTEKRGIDLPHVSPAFETNVKGIFVAGELGGMGLIRNAVKQGQEAVDNLASTIAKDSKATYELIIIGAGPAGISASLEAKKMGINAITLEQDSLGGAIYTFPRHKIIMTSPVELPLHGKVKFRETSKTELLNFWNDLIQKNDIIVQENVRIDSIEKEENYFRIKSVDGNTFTTQTVLLAIGRRGSPRKLNIPGEDTEKVAYRLLEPEEISGKDILVVGGGDSAIESALLLCDENNVTISYRGDKFVRLKQKNSEKLNAAIHKNKITVLFETELTLIDKDKVFYKKHDSDQIYAIDNNFVYIFAGGELPTEFLKKAGIQISTKKGEKLLRH